MTEDNPLIPPAEQQKIAATLEDSAEVMSSTQLEEQITAQPAAVEKEVVAINDHARNLSLQIALFVPLIAALLGLLNSLRMMRLPDVKPASSREGLDL